jgi:hypothetical protein
MEKRHKLSIPKQASRGISLSHEPTTHFGRYQRNKETTGGSMTKPKDNALALTGMTAEDLGESLIKAAQEKNRRELISKTVDIVALLMQGIDNAEKIIAEHQRYIKTYRARLAAIEAGEFSLDKYSSKQIKYNNPKLEDWL